MSEQLNKTVYGDCYSPQKLYKDRRQIEDGRDDHLQNKRLNESLDSIIKELSSIDSVTEQIKRNTDSVISIQQQYIRDDSS